MQGWLCQEAFKQDVDGAMLTRQDVHKLHNYVTHSSNQRSLNQVGLTKTLVAAIPQTVVLQCQEDLEMLLPPTREQPH